MPSAWKPFAAAATRGSSRWILLLAMFGLASGCAVELRHPSSLTNVEVAIRREFPEVKQVSTAQLSTWINDPQQPSPLLLDVRTADEYAVSHLRDAVRVDPAARPADVMATVKRDRLIVAYCAVGNRSSAFVRRLQKAGFTNAYNLEGSIFRWANEGRPVFRAREQVDEVHPYNQAWGRLLDSRFHPRREEAAGSAPVSGSLLADHSRHRCRAKQTAHGLIGVLAASIDSRNLTTLARSAELVSVSTPPVPEARCVTFASTWSSELAAPPWKNVSGNAWSDSSDGGTKPAAPSGAAALARTSLKNVGSNVPTCFN